MSHKPKLNRSYQKTYPKQRCPCVGIKNILRPIYIIKAFLFISKFTEMEVWDPSHINSSHAYHYMDGNKWVVIKSL